MRRIFPTVIALILLIAAGMASAADPLSGVDKEALEKAIRDYILEHPEVIIQSLEKYEAQQRTAREKAASAALVAHKKQLLQHPMTPISGNATGDVTIVEFFDYQCGFCKRSLASVLEILKQDPQVRVVWKELPILGETSEFAARAAMAANQQGKYFEFHVAVMGARGRLTPEKVLRLARKVGIDTVRLKRDMADPAISDYLRETLQLAQALGISGTPAFVVGSKLIPGALDKAQLEELITAERGRS